jgi:hypothetical protein
VSTPLLSEHELRERRKKNKKLLLFLLSLSWKNKEITVEVLGPQSFIDFSET